MNEDMAHLNDIRPRHFLMLILKSICQFMCCLTDYFYVLNYSKEQHLIV